MAMPAIHRRWTAAAVRELIQEDRAWPRYELIDGELLVTPAPGWPHQLAVPELLRWLYDYLESNPIGVVATSPADLELAPDTITQPDVFVMPAGVEIAGDAVQWSDIKRLLLAVEILSPSSVRRDRVVKRDFYLANGVDEYWIVDLDARMIEVWTPDRETPAIARETLTWHPANAAEPLELNVRALFEAVDTKRTRLGLSRRASA